MSTASKFDQDKVPMSLLPFEALKEVAKVLAYGAQKYGAHNWRQGFDYSRIESAMLRHYEAYQSGKDYDDETGCLHMASVACNALFLVSFQLLGIGKDDRFTQLARRDL